MNGKGDSLFNHELVGIGVGPANLSLLAALVEDGPAMCRTDTLFLEKKPSIDWHPALHVDEARTQIPFLKDLATLRNPCSRFTFTNYLHERRRLLEFAALGLHRPRRLEYEDYLRWVGGQLSHYIRFDTEALSIAPIKDGDAVKSLKIEISTTTDRGRDVDCIVTQNICLGVGMTPQLPDILASETDTIIHSARFLPTLHRFFEQTTRPWRFLVVGGGQTAGEIFSHLLLNYPNAQITGAARGFLYGGVDASYFVNTLYSDGSALDFYHKPTVFKRRVLSDLRRTNHAVVSGDVIERIGMLLYDDKIRGINRAQVLSYTDVVAIAPTKTGANVTLCDQSNGTEYHQAFDCVIFATGYDTAGMEILLEPLAPYLMQDVDGYQLDADHRLVAKSNLQVGIYLQGYASYAHGLTEGTITSVSLRAARIADSLRRHRRKPMQTPIYRSPSGPE